MVIIFKNRYREFNTWLLAKNKIFFFWQAWNIIR